MNGPSVRFEERLKELPKVPDEFGEDGGHFYRYYDALAEEIDNDMVRSLKAQLDGILIYAGLFAGVNTGFLALTLPAMSSSPADDTNALLLQLVTGGNGNSGGNITSAQDLPSASFSPPPGIFPINILFCLSLTLALLASFLAVLGQQWLVYYQKRSGGGAEMQRWEQLRRYLGAQEWHLEAVLDDVLPSLLQLGLAIFCVGLTLFLRTLSTWLCYTVAIPMGLSLFLIVSMAISAARDKWCPFKSPLSRALQLISPIISIAAAILICCALPLLFLIVEPVALTIYVLRESFIAGSARVVTRGGLWLIAQMRALYPQILIEIQEGTFNIISEIKDGLSEVVVKDQVRVERLRSIAAKRVLCTSEDSNALIYTLISLNAVKSESEALWLANDAEFHARMTNICEQRHSDATGSKGLVPQAAILSFTSLILVSGAIEILAPPGETRSRKQAYACMPSVLLDNVEWNQPRDKRLDALVLIRKMESSLLAPGWDDGKEWLDDYRVVLVSLTDDKAAGLTRYLATLLKASIVLSSHSDMSAMTQLSPAWRQGVNEMLIETKRTRHPKTYFDIIEDIRSWMHCQPQTNRQTATPQAYTLLLQRGLAMVNILHNRWTSSQRLIVLTRCTIFMVCHWVGGSTGESVTEMVPHETRMDMLIGSIELVKRCLDMLEMTYENWMSEDPDLDFRKDFIQLLEALSNALRCTREEISDSSLTALQDLLNALDGYKQRGKLIAICLPEAGCEEFRSALGEAMSKRNISGDPTGGDTATQEASPERKVTSRTETADLYEQGSLTDRPGPSSSSKGKGKANQDVVLADRKQDLTDSEAKGELGTERRRFHAFERLYNSVDLL